MANETAKIVVHWLERSRSQRLVWLLEECKLPYEVKTYKRIHNLAPPEMREVHPLGKSPILTIQAPGQNEPQAFAESGTIFEYVVEHFAPYLAPTRYKEGSEGKLCGETESWQRYRYYMHYSEGSLMSLVMRMHTVEGIKDADLSGVHTVLNRLSKTHLTFLESQLKSAPEGGKYFCGANLTGADLIMCFPLQVIQHSIGLAGYPELEAYIERMTSRPAYGSSIEKVEHVSGEKYILA